MEGPKADHPTGMERGCLHFVPLGCQASPTGVMSQSPRHLCSKEWLQTPKAKFSRFCSAFLICPPSPTRPTVSILSSHPECLVEIQSQAGCGGACLQSLHLEHPRPENAMSTGSAWATQQDLFQINTDFQDLYPSIVFIGLD